MDKKLILAVAGAGKTYTLVSKLNLEEKNLILAFTNQNIQNIKKEIKKKYKEIPKKIKIMTFHSFVYQFFILSYKPSILKFFNSDNIKIKGITFEEPLSPYKNNHYNKNYISQDKIDHYLKKDKLYCSLMTELIYKIKSKEENLLKRGIKNLGIFFDKIYIDEFQDFRKYDYEFLKELLKIFNRVLIVGDYYQHSVSGKNNTGKPFKKKNKTISYEEYIEEMRKLKLEVDINSLICSRRCPKEICEFVKIKLGVNILAKNENNGNVIFLKNNKEVKNILEDNTIKKLIFKESKKYNFNAINWGYSKGDTYDDACVILIDKLEGIDSKEFEKPKSEIILNKLYVALTRTKGNLYIIKKSQFDLIKDNYKKTSH